MGTVPWIVNSEIYSLKYRGIGGGIAAVANWILPLTEALGSAGTYLFFAGFSIGLVAISLYLKSKECSLKKWKSCYRKDTHPLGNGIVGTTTPPINCLNIQGSTRLD